MIENSTSAVSVESQVRRQPRDVHRPPSQAAPLSSGWCWLRQRGPGLLVLASLAAVAYWGHHSGWKVPKFSELTGKVQMVNDDWCAEHAVPASICVECNGSLLPRLKSTWCREHGVHNCPFERSDVVQIKSAPRVTQADLDRARRALALKQRRENSRACKMHERRVQFATRAVLDKMGIQVAPAQPGRILETVSASGAITYEQPSVASVSAMVPGRLWHVTKLGQLGATVRRGDLLALVDAGEVGRAKAAFLEAVAHVALKTKTVEILKPLVPTGAIPQARFLEAESAQREAEVRLVGAQQALVNLGLPLNLDVVKELSQAQLTRHVQFLGIPGDVAATLDPQTTSANLYPVLAPRDGIITRANVVAGEVVSPATQLFAVADPRRMWVILHVRNEDVPFVRVRDANTGRAGHSVMFRPDGSDVQVVGELVWRSTEVHEKSRTVQFRAELPNQDGSLLANTFGIGEIVLREEKDATLVPSEAVHWDGDCNIVFVQDKNIFEPGAPQVFHVRTIRPGVKNIVYGRSHTEIIAGLVPGEVVATQNSASLRAELLKNNLGAG